VNDNGRKREGEITNKKTQVHQMALQKKSWKKITKKAQLKDGPQEKIEGKPPIFN